MFFDELMSRPSEEELRRNVEDWWNIYESNKEMGLKCLIKILFCSAGIEHDTFDSFNHPDENLKRIIFSEDQDFSNAPISLQHYFITVNKLMNILLQHKSWAIIHDSHFIYKLISTIEYLKKSPYDSVRAVSYLTGMKIYRHIHDFSVFFMNVHNTHKTAIMGNIEELKNKVLDIFRCSMRDKASHLRKIPLKELLILSEENSDVLLDHCIEKYILRGLKDSIIENRKMCLDIVCNVFKNSASRNIDRQHDFFKRLLPELIISLRSNEDHDFLILKTVNQALQFLEVDLTFLEDMNLSMCLFSENESVLKEARTYFYMNHLRGKTGVDMISETVKFHIQSQVKNVPKLVESLILYFVSSTTWRDWEFCLDYKFNDVLPMYLYIFYVYISFLKTPSLWNLDSSTTNKMLDEFSIHFSKRWVELMTSDLITNDSRAQVFMLKLAVSFNILKLFKKTKDEIIDWTLTLFHQSSNHEVLKECIKCFNFFNSHDKNIEIEKSLISKVFAEFIQLLKSEDKDTEILNRAYIKVQIVHEICGYQDCYEVLWGTLTCLLDRGSDMEKTQSIISVLHNMVTDRMKKYVEYKNNMQMNNEDSSSVEDGAFEEIVEQEKITNWCTILMQAAAFFLHDTAQYINQCHMERIMLIPKLYGGMIRLSKFPPTTAFFCKLSSEYFEEYSVYCSQMMTSVCNGNGMCCELLNEYVELSKNGIICISHLKFFIMNFEEVNSHWVKIIALINYLINVKSNPLGAFAISNGLISFCNKMKELVNEVVIKRKLSEITIFIVDNLNKQEEKTFRNTILALYTYLGKLVEEGHVIFIELFEQLKSYFSEDSA